MGPVLLLIAAMLGTAVFAPAFGGHAPRVHDSPFAASGSEIARTPAIVPLNHTGNHSGNNSGNGTSHAPNLTLNASNGTLSISVALYYNSTPGAFVVSGTVTATGGGSPYTVQWDWGNGGNGRAVVNLSGTHLFIANTYSVSGNYTFQINVYGANGTYVHVQGAILANVLPPGLSVSLAAFDTVQNGAPTTQFNVSIQAGTPPYALLVQFGDGSRFGGHNATVPANFTVDHTYGPGTNLTSFLVTAACWDSTNATANGTLVVSPSYLHRGTGNGSNNSSGSRGSQGGSLTLSNGSLTLNLSYTLVTYTGWGNLTTWGNVSGGTSPYRVVFQPGDGYVANVSLSTGNNSTASVPFWFNHAYTSAGTYPFDLSVADSGGLRVLATQTFTVPGTGGNGSGNHTPYPSLVSVAIDASPVTGPAPLNVTLSALISGGNPPFTVGWSLPGSGTGRNLTGVEVTASYPAAGWYPATAFVYNTTTTFGTVLVGFWSVWIDVTAGSSGGNHSGNNSGNGTGNHSGHLQPPTSGTLSASGGAAANMLFTAFLVALALGGLVGAFAGYVFGAGGRRRPAPHQTEAPNESVRRPPER